MSGAKGKDTIACPVCRTELSLEQITSHLDDEQAFTRLVAMSVPMAHLVVAYVALFTPEKQSLTLRKKVRLIAQLLPDLQRQAIAHKGRDWPAPLPLWGQAIEHMLSARAAGRIDLPLTGHGYLYTVLAGLSNKQEAAQEQAALEHKRASAQGTVTVHGQPVALGAALQKVYGTSHTARPEAPTTAPPSEAMRAKIAAMLGKPSKPSKPGTPGTPGSQP